MSGISKVKEHVHVLCHPSLAARVMEFWRINLILIIFILCGLVVVRELFFIQVINGEYFKALAQGQYILKDGAGGERGEIFFAKGEPLAINKDWPLVFLSSVQAKEREKTANILADILQIDKNLILEKLQEESLYTVLKTGLQDEEIKKIEEANLTGVHLGKESGRYYPQETLASKVVGFLDKDGKGQYGLEEYYDETLQGKKKTKGSDLILTIDYSIQFQAERLLKTAGESLKIEGGEIIVMEPHTGKILALADFPNFDSNKYSEVVDMDVFQNSAVQKIFEPGSVFKPLTMAGALEEQKITPQTSYVDNGQVKIGGYTVYNYGKRVWGQRTMTEVLEKSINTGAVFAESQLGHNLFLKYVERFGVFEPTGVDISETYSENKEFKKGYEINFATASFGQGIEMTPLQLVRAYSGIANGGKLIKPYIVDKIKNSDIVTQKQPQIEETTVISQKTISQLTSMMVSVVENGYTKSAKVPGYYVAGKTGTAQISYAALKINKKGYSDKTWQSFIGFAPAFNPRFLILIKLDNPQAKTAEYSAVPIFHDLAKYIVDYWQIPPDYEL